MWIGAIRWDHDGIKHGATVVEIPSSHLAMVSHPRDVVRLTETAAEAISATVVSR